MKRYPIRALKYLIYFGLLFMGLFALLQATGYASMTFVDMMQSSNGWLFIAVIAGFALIYPFVGFTRRRMSFHAAKRAEDVERIMAMCGFKRIPNEAGDATDNNDMVFRPTSLLKRLSMIFEDKVEITTDDSGASYIAGHRSEVVRAYFRMGTYIA